jgi:anaerobic ribonucleoside-triphosphate reductase activating protein
MTRAEGPGSRFAVWVKGCSLQCDGCFNPHLWSSRGGILVSPDDLLQEVLTADVEGVTLLGGEPFEQAPALARFADLVRRSGLSVMVFSGYRREELERSVAPGVRELLAATDLLVDGPYIAEQPDRERPWVGSTNQRFHYLTDRYRHLEAGLGALADRIELRVTPSGDVSLNGWATLDQLDTLLSGITSDLGRRREP